MPTSECRRRLVITTVLAVLTALSADKRYLTVSAQLSTSRRHLRGGSR